MTTAITISTPKANRQTLAEAFGMNQTAVRYLEAMARDITVNLPNAISQNGATFAQAQQIGTGLTSGVTANAAALNLTAGTWDISGVIVFNSAAATVIEQITAGASAASAALGTPDTYQQMPLALSGNAAFNLAVPLTRIVLSSAATVYLVAQSIFNTAGVSVDGYIKARPGLG